MAPNGRSFLTASFSKSYPLQQPPLWELWETRNVFDGEFSKPCGRGENCFGIFPPSTGRQFPQRVGLRRACGAGPVSQDFSPLLPGPVSAGKRFSPFPSPSADLQSASRALKDQQRSPSCLSSTAFEQRKLASRDARPPADGVAPPGWTGEGPEPLRAAPRSV